MTIPHSPASRFPRRRSPSATSQSSVSISSASFSDAAFAAVMHQKTSNKLLRHILLLLILLTLSGILLYASSDLLGSLNFSSSLIFPSLVDDEALALAKEREELLRILKEAAIDNDTVILTTLNEAWAAPGSVIDLFLNNFRFGEGTERLLNHIVIIALDQKAFSRCLVLHKHCFSLVTEGVDFHQEAYFMTDAYLKMMWRRIDFLRSVLEIGFNFVFTGSISTVLSGCRFPDCM